jgi:hypothetical protein
MPIKKPGPNTPVFSRTGYKTDGPPDTLRKRAGMPAMIFFEAPPIRRFRAGAAYKKSLRLSCGIFPEIIEIASGG